MAPEMRNPRQPTRGSAADRGDTMTDLTCTPMTTPDEGAAITPVRDTGTRPRTCPGWRHALAGSGVRGRLLAALLVLATASLATSSPARSGPGATHLDAPAAVELWVPVASHNPGQHQSQWRSDLGILNTGTVTANIQLTFFGGSGAVGSTTYVPAGAQSILTDVVGQIGGSGSGAVRILSDQPVKVTARTYNQVPPGATCYANGTQGQSYPAVLATDGLSAGGAGYLAGLSESASYRCNIGVVNVGSSAATVLVELFREDGTKLTDYSVPLTPGQWAQETQPFRHKAGQTAMDRGYARITAQSGSGVLGFASVVDNITNDPTTVTLSTVAPVVPAEVAITEHAAGMTPGSQPQGITTGPDGALWFAEWKGNRIGRITTSGAVTEYAAGITPGATVECIAAGPDG
ncbi:MAG: hypothetical protein MUF10_03585, partial [Thermoanaerobaculaceae bacterium]|nr:hypothetical protein [Thermoanaerobaculaceae bacterium]